MDTHFHLRGMHHPLVMKFFLTWLLLSSYALKIFGLVRSTAGHSSDKAFGTSDCRHAPWTLSSMRESAGFFCDSEESWSVKKTIAAYQMARQTMSNNPRFNYFFQTNWEPDFSCNFEKRIGKYGDGGKWICDPHKLKFSDCLVYSLGSNNQWDFEEGILNEIGDHCEIHTFDGTLIQVHGKPENVSFHPWNIVSSGPRAAMRVRTMKRKSKRKSNISAPTGIAKSFTEIAAAFGHAGKRNISILKMDIEGGEYHVLPELLDSGALRKLGVQQIQLEVHASLPSSQHQLMKSLRNAGYAIFHKEPNILGRWPSRCTEYSFIWLEESFWQPQGLFTPRQLLKLALSRFMLVAALPPSLLHPGFLRPCCCCLLVMLLWKSRTCCSSSSFTCAPRQSVVLNAVY